MTRPSWRAPRGVGLVRLALLIALGGSMWWVATNSGSDIAGAPTWRSGVFAGYGPSGDEQFAAWRGAPIQSATDFIGSDDWSQIENPAWAISQWAADKAVKPDLSVALWPASGGSLAASASGANDGHFVALARRLVAGGLGSVSLRLGWEFNASLYRWSVATAADAANYAAAWRQIVTAMRSVRGQRFSFDWAPNLQAGGLDPALSYPGDAYVSDIGMDVYDWNERAPGESPSQRWDDLVKVGYGLAWQASFAAAHRKPIAFPEWALVTYAPSRALAGGDDPAFVQNMFNWFKSHNVSFENYFESDDAAAGTYYSIGPNSWRFPNASVRYQHLYQRR